MTFLPEDARSFSTPKPVRLIDRIPRIATGPGDLVLDLFAGSATTGHAVLKLNAEAGGGAVSSGLRARQRERGRRLVRDGDGVDRR